MKTYVFPVSLAKSFEWVLCVVAHSVVILGYVNARSNLGEVVLQISPVRVTSPPIDIREWRTKGMIDVFHKLAIAVAEVGVDKCGTEAGIANYLAHIVLVSAQVVVGTSLIHEIDWRTLTQAFPGDHLWLLTQTI